MATVLVVDDENNIRMFISANLAPRGFQVVEANSAEDALEKLRELTPDAVILDVLMPGMSGWDLARKMSEDERLSQIPIILLTASIADASSTGNYANVVERLVKPLSSSDLVTTVKKIVVLS
jgi:CheY-like chemotaxis protein